MLLVCFQRKEQVPQHIIFHITNHHRMSEANKYDPTGVVKKLGELDGLVPQVETPLHKEKFQKVQVCW